jgi:hypothetical protein
LIHFKNEIISEIDSSHHFVMNSSKWPNRM